MATLYGHAIKISWLGADHTYVTSNDGGVWPCWGRSAGGKVICSGTGSSAQANCLSQPKSTALVIYGVTGVCHQTANRILLPARRIVSAAKGYWASSLVYGTYGTPVSLPAWAIQVAACAIFTGSLKQAKANAKAVKAFKAEPADPALEQYLTNVTRLYDRHAANVRAAPGDVQPTADALGAELDLTVAYRLGQDAKSLKTDQLKKRQGDLIGKRAKIAAAFIHNELSAEQYAEQINAEIEAFQRDGQKILGDEAFQRLFGLAPGETVKLVDPKIAIKAH